MNEPKKQNTSSANDNLVVIQTKSAELPAFDPSVFDQLIEDSLCQDQAESQADADHPVCHLY
jgi:hypothetical protein